MSVIIVTIIILLICAASPIAAVFLMLIPLSILGVLFYAVWDYPVLFWIGIIIVVSISALAIKFLDFK